MSRRTWLYLSVGLAAILLSASSDSSMPRLTTTEPYPLTYPSYFGNRINITADNPLTVQGVALGRRLFYEKNLSANNSISCGTNEIFSSLHTGTISASTSRVSKEYSLCKALMG